MAQLQISELATRAGVATSTLRYYERIGLVEPAGRADNGYRQYDESAVERVAFIGRAKRLGMSLDDVSNLIDAWFDGECQPLREHLRGLVSGRLRELRRGIASDLAFEQRLAQILVRLSEEGPVPERCTSDCGCDALAPAEPPQDRAPFGCSLSAGATRDGHGDAAPIGCSLSAGATRDRLGDAAPFGCSLSAGATRDRLGEWRQLLALATEIVPSPDGWRAVFAVSPAVTAELGRLCGAEIACCPFFAFQVAITAESVVLTVGGPEGADEAIALLLDAGTVGSWR